jgi:hypothetical protein
VSPAGYCEHVAPVIGRAHTVIDQHLCNGIGLVGVHTQLLAVSFATEHAGRPTLLDASSGPAHQRWAGREVLVDAPLLEDVTAWRRSAPGRS